MNDQTQSSNDTEEQLHPHHLDEELVVIRSAGLWLCGYTDEDVEIGEVVTLTDTYLLEIGIDHIWTPHGVAAQHGTSPTSLAVLPPTDDTKLNGVDWTGKVDGFRRLNREERLVMEGMIGRLNAQAVQQNMKQRAANAGIALPGPDADQAAEDMSQVIANARGRNNRH